MINTLYYIIEIYSDIDTNESLYHFFKFDNIKDLNDSITQYNSKKSSSSKILYIAKVDYVVLNLKKKSYFQEDFLYYLEQKLFDFFSFLISNFGDLKLNKISDEKLLALRYNIKDLLDLAYSFSFYEPVEGELFESFLECKNLKNISTSMSF